MPAADDGLGSRAFRSLPDPSIHRLRDLRAELGGAGAAAGLHGPAAQRGHCCSLSQAGRDAALAEQARQLGFDGGLEAGPVSGTGVETGQDQPLDVQGDVHAGAGSAHLKSASLIGFSSLRSSERAASRTSGMVTGVPARAARKAALSAMLWMWPPVKLKRDRRSQSSAPTGASDGK